MDHHVNQILPPRNHVNHVKALKSRCHPELKLKIPAQVFCMSWCADFEFRVTQPGKKWQHFLQLSWILPTPLAARPVGAVLSDGVVCSGRRAEAANHAQGAHIGCSKSTVCLRARARVCMCLSMRAGLGRPADTRRVERAGPG